MELLTCIKDFNVSCLTNWGIEELISIVVFSVLCVGVYRCFEALYIAKTILKKNRGGIGKGPGTRAADAFMRVWYSDKSYYDKLQENIANSQRTIILGAVADEYLVKRKLVEVYENPRDGRKWVRPIKKFRNYIVAFAVEFDLVHKYDDSKKLYKDLKAQGKK